MDGKSEHCFLTILPAVATSKEEKHALRRPSLGPYEAPRRLPGPSVSLRGRRCPVLSRAPRDRAELRAEIWPSWNSERTRETRKVAPGEGPGASREHGEEFKRAFSGVR